MREIPLSQGKVALVDDEDYEYLSQFRWYANNIAGLSYARRISKGCAFMHRMIIEVPKGFVTDHIDGNGLNNQRKNLRIVTVRGNGQNRHQLKSSKYPGVSWHKKTKKWMASIQINYKRIFLGVHPIEEEAYQAYKKECEKLDN